MELFHYKVLLKECRWGVIVMEKNSPFFFFMLSDTFYSRPESKQEPVKTEMGPPPSPASTCSDASSIASSASMPYSK